MKGEGNRSLQTGGVFPTDHRNDIRNRNVTAQLQAPGPLVEDPSFKDKQRPAGQVGNFFDIYSFIL